MSMIRQRHNNSCLHIGANPSEDDVGSAVAVMIGLFRRSITVLLLWGRLASEGRARRVPNLVYVLTLRRDFHLHHVLPV